MKVGATILMTAFLLVLPLAAMAGNNENCIFDTDSDGVPDCADNCTLVANASPSDCDTDLDGYGNVCDGDFDQGGTPKVNATDFTGFFLVDFAPPGIDSGVGTNMNCAGTPAVNATDFTAFFLPIFVGGGALPAGTLGPSGLACAGTIPCP